MNYSVNELFQTIQGEGWCTGQPSIFIRLQGCDVGCSWCDTKHTWEKHAERYVAPDLIIQTDHHQTGRWSKHTSQSLLEAVKDKSWTAKHVVITGGEPCMYDLRPLSLEFEEAGYDVQVETSGTYPVLVSDSAWVTVSPKIAMRGKKKVLLEALERADEIKHPVATMSHIDQLDTLLSQLNTKKRVCLQPISQKKHATELAMKICIERNWRLSVQVHKYLDID